MVALAGDYFESLDEMRALAGSANGRAQIRWARWHGLGSAGTEPRVADAVRQAVLDRYYALAARNMPHFSAGGTAASSYRDYHRLALQDAFEAGLRGDAALWQRARTTEAFGNHFLTDMFAGGHVRTPRTDMRTWYLANHPNSIDQFVRYMAQHMRAFLQRQHPVADFLGRIPNQADIEGQIRQIGGTPLPAFSLGDIVSLAYHNRDNIGLNVVSQRGQTGKRVSKGHRFLGVGDSHLHQSAVTRGMVVAAVRASLADLDAMRAAGQNAARAASAARRPLPSKTGAGFGRATRHFRPH